MIQDHIDSKLLCIMIAPHDTVQEKAHRFNQLFTRRGIDSFCQELSGTHIAVRMNRISSYLDYFTELATENNIEPLASEMSDDEQVFLYQKEVERLRNKGRDAPERNREKELNIKLLQELLFSLRHLKSPIVDEHIPAILSEPSDDPAILNIDPNDEVQVLDCARAMVRDGSDFNIFGTRWLDNPMVCFVFKQHMFYLGISDLFEVVVYANTDF